LIDTQGEKDEFNIHFDSTNLPIIVPWIVLFLVGWFDHTNPIQPIEI